MIKKGLNFVFGLFLISTVSASSADYLFETSSLILIGIFLLVFYASNIAINRSMRYANSGIKIILGLSIALFTTWKASTSDMNIEGIAFNLGLTPMIESYGPIIIVIGLIFAMFKWGIPGVFVVAGGIMAFIGYIGQESGVLYNGWALTAIGLVMAGIGALFIYRKHIKNAYQYASEIKKPKITMCTFVTILGLGILIFGLTTSNNILFIAGIVIFLLGAICPKSKKNSYDYTSSRIPQSRRLMQNNPRYNSQRIPQSRRLLQNNPRYDLEEKKRQRNVERINNERIKEDKRIRKKMETDTFNKVREEKIIRDQEIKERAYNLKKLSKKREKEEKKTRDQMKAEAFNRVKEDKIAEDERKREKENTRQIEKQEKQRKRNELKTMAFNRAREEKTTEDEKRKADEYDKQIKEQRRREKDASKIQKMINHLNSLLKEKIWSLSKHTQIAGKGIPKSIKKVKTLEKEIPEIQNKIAKYTNKLNNL